VNHDSFSVNAERRLKAVETQASLIGRDHSPRRRRKNGSGSGCGDLAIYWILSVASTMCS
jgi:hypothetical protein